MSCSATLENDLSAGINISHRNRGFEIGDRGNRDGRFLLGVVFFFLIGLIVDLGEQFGGDARATDQRAELCMFDGRAEGILARRWRSRSQRVVFSVSTSFAREVDGDGRPSGGMFGVIGPGFSSGFGCDMRRFESTWRIPATIHTFRR